MTIFLILSALTALIGTIVLLYIRSLGKKHSPHLPK
jgi:hypothetical protein